MDTVLKFRSADHHEFPKLILMWRDCFKDSYAAADNIFKNLQKPENIFILEKDRKPVAMLSIREFTLTSPLKLCKAAYIYGVAVSPPEQRRGYAAMLLRDIDALLAHRQYACSVLAPAEDSLFAFYERHGFEKAFNINKAEFTSKDINELGSIAPLERISASELGLIRDSRLSDSRMFASWDKEYLEYVAKESEFYGGGVFACTIGGKRICAVCYKDGETLYVKELGATPHTLEASLRSIHAHFAAERYKLYLREDVKISYTNNLLPFAMIKWYDNEIKNQLAACEGAPPYIAHVLD